MEYISYNVGTQDFPDIYVRALGLGHIYQANPSCPCYNYYIYIIYIIYIYILYIYIYIYISYIYISYIYISYIYIIYIYGSGY